MKPGAETNFALHAGAAVRRTAQGITKLQDYAFSMQAALKQKIAVAAEDVGTM